MCQAMRRCGYREAGYAEPLGRLFWPFATEGEPFVGDWTGCWVVLAGVGVRVGVCVGVVVSGLSACLPLALSP